MQTVVVVEDDETIRDLLTTLLTEEQSYHVLSASSGEGALRLLSTLATRPHLFLLDYMLGAGMNGIELYDHFCASGWKDIPTLMISAALPEREVAARRLIGVPKPFDLDALLTLIEETIHRVAPSSCT